MGRWGEEGNVNWTQTKSSGIDDGAIVKFWKIFFSEANKKKNVLLCLEGIMSLLILKILGKIWHKFVYSV